MAYMSQERKKELAVGLKATMAPYGIKYSVRVRNHSTIVMTITEGPVDFIKNAEAIRTMKMNDQDFGNRGTDTRQYLQINTYSIDSHHSGLCAEILNKAEKALNMGNHDRSDVQSDYFDVGWYVDINVGSFDKPYRVVSK
jgi:hypothetical protein